MKIMLVFLITFYQRYLSFDNGMLRIFAPGGACKYNPTCSEYTKQMIIKHGGIKGLLLGIRRIATCR